MVSVPQHVGEIESRILFPGTCQATCPVQLGSEGTDLSNNLLKEKE